MESFESAGLIDTKQQCYIGSGVAKFIFDIEWQRTLRAATQVSRSLRIRRGPRSEGLIAVRSAPTVVASSR
jgi:hypothetical protein